MGKVIFCALVIAGLCFGQLIEEKKPRNAWDTKYLALEVFGGAYYTSEHSFDEPRVVLEGIVLTPNLPLFMWYGGGRIDYKFASALRMSLKGSHSYTRNLFSLDRIKVPECPKCILNLMAISLSMLYISEISPHWDYQIGAGLECDYIRVFWVYGCGFDTIIYKDTISNGLYVRPTFVGNIQLNISTSLYVKTQIEASFCHFTKTGARGIHLPLIYPGLSIGLGYKFDLTRGKP